MRFSVEDTITCPVCGAKVSARNHPRHQRWHASLEARLGRLDAMGHDHDPVDRWAYIDATPAEAFSDIVGEVRRFLFPPRPDDYDPDDDDMKD